MKAIATALVKSQKAFGPALKTSTNPHKTKTIAFFVIRITIAP